MLKGEKPETVSILRQLAAQGYDTYGLTNWSAETIDIAFDRFSFFSLMKGIVVSGREKMIKPDRRIYRLLLERYKLAAEECIFIDDNLKNVEAAQLEGMHGIHFRDANQLSSDLSRMGVYSIIRS